MEAVILTVPKLFGQLESQDEHGPVLHTLHQSTDVVSAEGFDKQLPDHYKMKLKFPA